MMEYLQFFTISAIATNIWLFLFVCVWQQSVSTKLKKGLPNLNTNQILL